MAEEPVQEDPLSNLTEDNLKSMIEQLKKEKDLQRVQVSGKILN